MSDYEVLSGRHNWISFPGNQLVGETQDQCQWPIIWITRVKGGGGGGERVEGDSQANTWYEQTKEPVKQI